MSNVLDTGVVITVRHPLTILLASFAAFFAWSALFWLLINSLHMLQEVVPSYKSWLIYVRIFSFILCALATVAECIEYSINYAKVDKPWYWSMVSIVNVWVLAVTTSSHSIMVHKICPSKKDDVDGDRKRILIYLVVSIFMDCLAGTMVFFTITAAISLITSAMVMSFRLISAAVIDLIDKKNKLKNEQSVDGLEKGAK